jgi:hypothetical protein
MSKARDLAGIFNLGPRSGTTAQRPSTAEVGDIFYNGTTGKTEIYTTTGWKEMASGIPFGNNAGRPADPQPGQPYFNGQENRLEIYTQSTGWQNIVAETPGVVSVSGNYIADNSSNTLVISGTNFSTGAQVFAVGTNLVEIQADSATVNSIVQITAVFSGLSNANEPYDIKVVNPSNLYGILPDALYVNQTPTWNTPAGTIGSFPSLQTVSASVSATDPDGSALSYTLSSGSLPSGVTLNSSNGSITGTPPASSSTTIYNFSVTASDGVNSSTRSFSLSVTPYQISSEVLIVGGGGGGGYHSGTGANGGGGAGGVMYNSSYTLVSGTYSVSVGSGGLGGTQSSEFKRGNTGSSSYWGSIVALGGGYGGAGNHTEFYSGGAGGSGGGATGSNVALAGSATQASSSGFTGYGFSGGAGHEAGGSNHNGGGGGGAGGAGQSGTSTYAGSGGNGIQLSITGTPSYYAAGGGGSTYLSDKLIGNPSIGQTRVNGIGGAGTIGNQEANIDNPNIDAVANTGSGGGSARWTSINRAGNGGSGVLVIAYPNTMPDLVISAGLTYNSPTRSGYKVYRFTAGTGTVTF